MACSLEKCCSDDTESSLLTPETLMNQIIFKSSDINRLNVADDNDDGCCCRSCSP